MRSWYDAEPNTCSQLGVAVSMAWAAVLVHAHHLFPRVGRA
jgi:hypothetical protein